MGVLINACKLCEKVGDACKDENEYYDILKKYDELGISLITIDEVRPCPPFKNGIYTYEAFDIDVSISYGSNWDFLESLDDFYDTIDEVGSFSVTRSNSTIDGYVSYITAKDMLEEFENGVKNGVKGYLYERFDEEYGGFMWSVYKRYMEVLRECVRVSGIIRYY